MNLRAIVLFFSGIVVIYLASLFQDAQYPHPITIETESSTEAVESTQVLLTKVDNYFYKTQIFFDATLKGNQGRLLGINSMQLYVNGYIVQSRKKWNDTVWEDCFSHILPGPITHYSTLDNDFAVLYHVVDENEKLDYYARVYFVLNGNMEYKDLHLPGNTMIDSFTLEKDSILYSRNPDQYRFRVIQLPKNIFTTKDEITIQLSSGQPGESTRAYHQPKGTKNHLGILSKLYSSNDNIYRVFSLDIHQTRTSFYINATLVDGIKNEEWIRRDHLNTTHKVYVDTGFEYMTFVDGMQYQEPAKITLPPNLIASIPNKKTIVLPILANSFLTLDFTDNIERLQSDERLRNYLYKDGNDYLPEFYFWMQDDIYDDEHGIKGMQLNEQGTVLAVWTESNRVYIYQRGQIDKSSVGNLPHHLDRKLEWILKMSIAPMEGQLGTDVPIGNGLFWDKDDSHYLSIILKNGVVNTYLIDDVKKEKEIKSFLREKIDLWTAMFTVVVIFVTNEIRNHP